MQQTDAEESDSELAAVKQMLRDHHEKGRCYCISETRVCVQNCCNMHISRENQRKCTKVERRETENDR